MAHVDMEHMQALWNRVGDVFLRKADLPEIPAKSDYIANAGIELVGNTITITFYDGNGNERDAVSFTVSN